MNSTESKKLVLDDVLKTFTYSEEHARAIDELTTSCKKDLTPNDAVNVLAWRIARDLYSEASTDQVNLERIAFGLETASRQLLSLGSRLRDIGAELQTSQSQK